MLPLVAKMLGHCRGISRALHAQQRRCIGGGCHHHRPGTPFRAQNIFDKLFDLAPALADEPDHNHVGAGVPRHHP